MGRDDEDKEDSGPVYKTKVVQFFNRSVPIVLQNDNGPCPLLAICKTTSDLHSSICTLIHIWGPKSLWLILIICVSVSGNVLLLRNAVNLSTEITEVSSSKLLSLIAETLIDTNVINGVLTMPCFMINCSWSYIPVCSSALFVANYNRWQRSWFCQPNLERYDDVGCEFQAVC